MSFLSPITSFLSIGKSRNFSGFKGYVTIQESTTDAMEITQHPVQSGSSISDHAFKKPTTLSIQIQFDTSSNIPLIGGLGLVGGLFGKSLSEIYQDLLDLQNPTGGTTVLTPFDVVTLKRTYKTMLISTLGCTTDKRTENVLAINVTFQEAIIVQIQAGFIKRSLLKTPKINQAIQNAGNKSAFLTVAQGITNVVGK